MLKLHGAISWASRAHQGEPCNYTDEPYAAHLMEMLQILTTMNASEDLQVAGILHGAVEKNPAAVELFWPMFGNTVAVLLYIYDPGATAENWRWKKQRLLEKLEVADREVQLLVMADCVADLRSLTCSYRECGERTWKKSGVKRGDLSWYYSEVQDILCDFQDDEEAREIYWEFVNLYKDLFVTYYLDDEEGILYQIAHGLYGYAMSREDLMWNQIEDQIPENAEVIPREEAEGLEELWTSHKEELYHDETLDGNGNIETAIAAFRKNEDRETLEALADVIARRMEERGHLIMPVEDGVEEGNIIPRTITTDDGETVIAAFTNYEEMKKGPYSEMLSLRIEHLFEAAKELEHVGGIVINPWGQFMYVGKDLISIIEERVNLLEDEDDDGEIQVEIVEISTDPTLLN